jgi:preprotein translocase subunit SecY
MPSIWRQAWTAPEIRSRLLITLLLLGLYRLLAHIPLPGVDRDVLSQALAQGGGQGTLIDILQLLSGGTVLRFSILALGIGPYVAAGPLVNTLVRLIPRFQRAIEDDPRAGWQAIERWTYYVSVPLGLVQAYSLIQLLTPGCGEASSILPRFGFTTGDGLYTVSILVSMTAGSVFAVWLARLISEHGVRQQGVNLVLFSGIAATLPGEMAQAIGGGRWDTLLFYVVLVAAGVLLVVMIGQGQRQVPVMYPGRRIGSRMSMPVKGSLPIHMLMGQEAVVAGQALLALPASFAGLLLCSSAAGAQGAAGGILSLFGSDSPVFGPLLFLAVAGLTFLYADVTFREMNFGENLKRAGAQIPGVSRGQTTERYLARILHRLTLVPALFFGLLAIAPWIAGKVLGVEVSLVEGESLFILTTTVIDVFRSFEADLKLKGYGDSLLVH